MYAAANKGKTSSIRKVYEMLGGRKEVLKREGDISEIVMRGGFKIGCDSLGDPGSAQKEWLEDLMNKHHCDIIVTACRTRGSTVDILMDLSEKYGYSVEWLSLIYGFDNENIFEMFYQANAQVIINIIDKIIGGEL